MSLSIVENKNSTLHKLINYLDNSKFSEALELMKNTSFSAEDLYIYTDFNSNRYARICISRNEKYELVLLCWDKEQGTQIHCHDGQECYVEVIKGDILEKVYTYDYQSKKLNLIDENIVHTGMSADVEPGDFFHSLQNISSGQAISLHLYISPITNCRVYDKEKGEFVRKELSYDEDHSFID